VVATNDVQESSIHRLASKAVWSVLFGLKSFWTEAIEPDPENLLPERGSTPVVAPAIPAQGNARMISSCGLESCRDRQKNQIVGRQNQTHLLANVDD